MVEEVLGNTPGKPATIFYVNIRRDQEPDGDYSTPEGAAKPDDADAEASEWDEWIATSFVHTGVNERAWSVYSGTYNKKITAGCLMGCELCLSEGIDET